MRASKHNLLCSGEQKILPKGQILINHKKSKRKDGDKKNKDILERDNSLCGKQREKTTSDNAVIQKRLNEMEKTQEYNYMNI